MLIQSAQAFQQMVGALSWAIDNLGKVADSARSAERVFGLAEAVNDFDELVRSTTGRADHGRAQRAAGLAFRDFATTRRPDQIQSMNVEIGEGERVLFTGETGAGSNILKAVAGIGPWGDRHSRAADGAKLFFMPPGPICRPAPLRATIDYRRGDAPVG